MASLNRRDFIASGMGGAVGAAALGRGHGIEPTRATIESVVSPTAIQDFRAGFPRVDEETYLNAAGMMPLGDFGKLGLERYMAYQRLGEGGGRGEYRHKVTTYIRGLFADLIGADEDEIGYVYCTKAGEQVVIDCLDELRRGKNIVTNDLHFTGSLHNYIGLKRRGMDVRIVRSRDWRIDHADMAAAMDDNTALVAVSLVSNINGHNEDIEAIARMAHERGAIVYADIIQAAGITPIDVKRMGIDVAACGCYKWLYGVHGTGFIYVNRELQGTRLADHRFPGSARHNYEPWIETPDDAQPEYIISPRHDASRYQAGHINYLGYCAVFEGLVALQSVGVENALAHSVKLNRHLLDRIGERCRCITPDVDRSPMITFLLDDPATVRERLSEEKIVVSLSGNRMRVSPALYSNEPDMDRLAGVMLA